MNVPGSLSEWRCTKLRVAEETTVFAGPLAEQVTELASCRLPGVMIRVTVRPVAHMRQTNRVLAERTGGLRRRRSPGTKSWN